jgi:hypothetical protein
VAYPFGIGDGDGGVVGWGRGRTIFTQYLQSSDSKQLDKIYHSIA